MTNQLAKTLQLLRETKNEAALDVLLRAIDSPQSTVQTLALRTILERHDLAGHKELLRRWHTFSESWRTILHEGAARLEGALRAAILSSDLVLHRNACEAVVYLQLYDLIPTLIAAAEDRGNARAELAAQATVQLCEQLSAENSTPHDKARRRDPVLVRQYVFRALETAVERYEQHQRSELAEAFLILAQPDDRLLKRCLVQTNEKAHTAIVGLMLHSARTCIMRLSLAALDDSQAPGSVLNVIARRKDPAFLQLLFGHAHEGYEPPAKGSLRKIEQWAWLRDEFSILPNFSDEEVAGSVRLAMASGANRLRVHELLKYVLQHCGPISRRAACAALAEFRGGEANQLVLDALVDPDPQVQANAVAQLRSRGIPGTMSRLVELVDSPHAVVQQAARSSLSEFNFQRYLSAFEMLDPSVRRGTGLLVKRIDPRAIEQLIAELESPSRTRRLRGIEVATAMGAVPEVELYVQQSAFDEDHFIRAEAARALAYVDSEDTRETLCELLVDRSMSVQEAARNTLEQLIGDSFTPPERTHTPLPIADPRSPLPPTFGSLETTS